ncbi:3-oxoacyl-ACP reductase [Cellulomonas denverensis]|uniref:3-oxoacyl-ACP reductase n=1 Tax=Cellulomonas denverensis TaxID=264297 RepID=A0A7X6QZ91_9CELL|nr:3-oxoacyl-ACP reductase [Cellulomonas denverensis]NKY23004.1 3-oxoacyl-ACP reductase [Cellulomonas denverensis]GIG23917.1 3-oxoacyl-ACP reductase [Cellulomonas denverensis]
MSTDTYLDLVNGGLTGTLAKKLGLPRPTPLRRYRPGSPLVDGPVLVLGTGKDADTLAGFLSGTDGRTGGWDLDVRRHAGDGTRFAAAVLVLTEVERPQDLSEPVLALAPVLKTLARHGRVVTVSRPALDDQAPALAAARQGIDGVLRSLAKELRGGATGNGVVVADDVPVTAPAVLGALRFFLSSRSAYVDGQLIEVGSEAGTLPADWEQPLAGRVAVVTGAARGIGESIAHTLARDGATVIAVDVPAAGEALTTVANAVRGTALQLDVTADDAGDRILRHALDRHGRLDIVVHNAGITRDKLLANMTPDRWDAVLAVNIAAQLRINEALLTSGDLTDAPRIVSLASTSGIAGNRGQTNYAASKGGVIGMVRATAPLLTAFGGTANAVAPGFIETEMTAKMPPLTRQVARRLSSLQQGGLPVDVAEAVAFLASPPAGGIVGQVLRVCGQAMVGR